MKRLTNEEVKVDAIVDGMIGPFVDLTNMKPKLLDVILNGPTLNGGSKAVLRSIIRQLYSALAAYEDSGCAPEEVLPKDKADEIAMKLMRLADLESLCSYDRLRELAEADKDGRVVVLPCKVGDALYRTSPSGVVVHRVANVVYRGLTSRWYIDTIPNLPYASEELGKTAFLTREEAEKALEAMEDE